MAAHARASVKRFDWGRIAEKVRVLYQQLAVEEHDIVASCR
jgi:hypothetical protein